VDSLCFIVLPVNAYLLAVPNVKFGTPARSLVIFSQCFFEQTTLNPRQSGWTDRSNIFSICDCMSCLQSKRSNGKCISYPFGRYVFPVHEALMMADLIIMFPYQVLINGASLLYTHTGSTNPDAPTGIGRIQPVEDSDLTLFLFLLLLCLGLHLLLCGRGALFLS